MEGFLAPRPFRPATLGFIVLGHVAVLTAVILAKGPAAIPLPTILKTYTVPDPVDPPPLPPEPLPKTQAPPSRPDTPTRIVDIIPPDTTPRIDSPPVPPLPPLPPLPPATGGTIARTVPEPVFVAAQPARNGSFQPAYPPALQRAEVEGKAIVRVLIGADGRVHAVEIVSADDPAFAEATRRQALKAWRFAPATRDGVAVESWRTMTVHFRMDA